MNCQAWVAPITVSATLHREDDLLVIAEQNESGHRFTEAEATTIKAGFKMAKGTKLGRVRRCGGRLVATLTLAMQDEGTPYQSPALNVAWQCNSCGCTYHPRAPRTLEEIEQSLNSEVSRR